MPVTAEHFFYLREAAPGDRGRLQHIWLPTEECICLPLEQPSAPRGKWPKLLPWLLEDQLLGDPADWHLVAGEHSTVGRLGVVAVEREQMRRWCEHCERLGWQPRTMAPDVLALPWQPGTVTVLVDGERVLVRQDLCQGFAGPAEWAWALLRDCCAGARRVCYAADAAVIPADIRDDGPVAPLPELWHRAGAPLNLLQGEFAPRGRRATATGQWWAPGLAAALALACYLGWLLADTAQAQREAEAVLAAMRADFTTLYGAPAPQAAADIRSEAEFQQRVQSRGAPAAGAGVWPLFQAVDPLLAGCAGCRVNSLAADSSGLLLRLAGDVDALQRQLAEVPALAVRSRPLEGGDVELVITGGPW